MKQDTGSRVQTRLKDPQALARLMRHLDVSQRELAKIAGVSNATISRLVNSERERRIDNAAAKKIARRLGQPFENLFDVELFYVTQDYARRNVA